jgi:membrane-associated protease RseP (regulator of RpoE activity)
MISGLVGVIVVSLGIMLIVLMRSPVVAAALQTIEDAGVLVTSVARDGAAAQAGLKRGDIILAIDDQTTNEVATLQEYVLSKQAGDQVRLNVQHGDELRTLTVTLDERQGRPHMGVVPFVDSWSSVTPFSGTAGFAAAGPAFQVFGGMTGPLTGMTSEAWPATAPFSAPFGLHVELGQPGQPFSDTLFFQGPGMPFSHTMALPTMPALPFGDFLIHAVAEDSPAERAGLLPGDIITAVNGTALESPFAVIEAVDAADPGDSLTLTVLGESGEERSVTVTLGEDPQRAGAAYLGVNSGGADLRWERHGMPLLEGPWLDSLEDFTLPFPALACQDGAPCGRLEI